MELNAHICTCGAIDGCCVLLRAGISRLAFLCTESDAWVGKLSLGR